MPSLDAPITLDDEGIVLDGELAAPSVDAVRALLPAYARRGDDSPMRAAVLAMLAACANFLQVRAGRVLNAGKTPRDAEGRDLDAWGEPLGQRRLVEEGDPPYRERLLTPTKRVSPSAIRPAVAALVAQFTNDAPNFQEPARDAMFLAPASASDPPKPHATVTSTTVPAWRAFIQPKAQRLWANYPDRVAGTRTGAYLVPGADAWDPRVSQTDPNAGLGAKNGPGARLWVTLPTGAGDRSKAPHTLPLAFSFGRAADFLGGVVGGSAGPNTTPRGAWMGPAGAPYQNQYGFVFSARDSLERQVATELERRRADGVRTAFHYDPLMTTGK